MKDFFIKNIHMFILIYAGYNLFLIYEERTLQLEASKVSKNAAQTKLTRSKASLDEVDRFNKNLEESRKRVKGVVENIKKIQRQLPSEINDSDVQRILEGISNTLKMKGMEMKPKVEVSHGFYYSKDYLYDSKGTFLQGLILFEKLEELSKTGRILNVKYVRMTLDNEADTRSRFKVLNLSTVVESYRYDPNYQLSSEPVNNVPVDGGKLNAKP